VFVRSGATWTQQAKLTARTGDEAGAFGSSVAIDRDTVVVGAPFGSFDVSDGVAYVFVRDGTSWTQQQKLTAGPEEVLVTFGLSVAVDGDRVGVVAVFNKPGGVPDNGKGADSVLVRSGTTWTQQAKLTARDGAVRGFFGTSVSIDGDTVVVGAIGAVIGGNTNQGAA